MSRGLRVLVATGPVGTMTARQAGDAIATGWQDAMPGSHLAVIPLGVVGDSFGPALADVLGGEVSSLCLTNPSLRDSSLRDTPLRDSSMVATVIRADETVALAVGAVEVSERGWCPQASSESIGRAVATLLSHGPRPRRLILELGTSAAHDAGAGILAGLGASADRALSAGAIGLAGMTQIDLDPAVTLLSGIRVDLVVPSSERDRALLGLRGLTARRGRVSEIDTADVLAVDAAIGSFASTLARAQGSRDAAADPGAGACGTAFGALALGASLQDGPSLIADLVDARTTLAGADVILTGTASLDVVSRGGATVAAAAAWGEQALTPVVALAGQALMGNRELRTLGIESVHGWRDPQVPGRGLVGPEPDFGPGELAELAARVARSWNAG